LDLKTLEKFNAPQANGLRTPCRYYALPGQNRIISAAL